MPGRGRGIRFAESPRREAMATRCTGGEDHARAKRLEQPTPGGGLPTFDLPEPRPEFREAGGQLNSESTYFNPDRWEEEQWRRHPSPPGDPVVNGTGRQEGR